jgi:hypothetical protein
MFKFNFTGQSREIGGDNTSETGHIGKLVCQKCKKTVTRLYNIKINGKEKKLCVECKKRPRD